MGGDAAVARTSSCPKRLQTSILSAGSGRTSPPLPVKHSGFIYLMCVFFLISIRSVSPGGLLPAESLHARLFHGHQALSQGARKKIAAFRRRKKQKGVGLVLTVVPVFAWPQVKSMANPFAYAEYRKDKIRQKIEESRTQRVQVKVRCRSPCSATRR